MMNKLLATLILSVTASSAFACSDERGWVTIADTPLSPAYLPQGLSHDESGLILTLYSDVQEPHVRLFRYDIEWTELNGTTDPLRHTSGIVPYNDYYFLIDYETGLIAKAQIDNNSFEILDSWDTGNDKISSGFITRISDRDYLVVSVFGFFGEYLFFDTATLNDEANTIEPEFRLPGSAFIQGNYSAGGGIYYETANQIGRDIINISTITTEHGVQSRFGHSIDYPDRMIEDLTIFNGDIYTTDEKSFRLWRYSDGNCANQ
ncbi:MAG: hypothetical protein COA47_18015 [Robiginitomaculum sp.]|nr:MAG: hypothetical protein COA47_18015 [Robiginitomaculum sp.]